MIRPSTKHARGVLGPSLEEVSLRSQAIPRVAGSDQNDKGESGAQRTAASASLRLRNWRMDTTLPSRKITAVRGACCRSAPSSLTREVSLRL